MTEILVLLAAILAVWVAWTMFLSPNAGKKDEVKFADLRGVVRTDTTMDSSYQQRTNHMPAPMVMSPPLEGIQTPFQVNAYKAYVK